jgi:hypothetical protein
MDWIYVAQDKDQGNEPLGYIKCWEFFESLSNCLLPKKDLAEWNEEFVNVMGR